MDALARETQTAGPAACRRPDWARVPQRSPGPDANLVDGLEGRCSAYPARGSETAGIRERWEAGHETLNVRQETREEMHEGGEWVDVLEQWSGPSGPPLITIGREGSWESE